MLLPSDERTHIRECSLEWHCPEIKIHQTKLKDGFVFKGYGIIKISENGNLYLDFICLESNKRVDFRKPIPEDPLDEDQIVTMEAVTLTGDKLTSIKLRVNPTFNDSISSDPTFYRIGLSEIEFTEETRPGYTTPMSLYFEFNEECRIPANKTNTTESTLGTRSSSWNQTTLNYENFEINIIKHADFTEVSANGDGIALEKVKDAISFYISLSSGVFLQPYIIYFRENEKCITQIKSIDKKIINNHISPPICDHVHDENKKSLAYQHFELLGKICQSVQTDNNNFESVYSQWKRVWFSFLSPEISVSILTLSVSIEGILNDIFIPEITTKMHDENFENEKYIIIEELNKIENISPEQIETLSNHVNKWGNVHPKKALEYLVSKKVIEKKQKNTWIVLRNSSAHPRLMKVNAYRNRKDLNRIVICLGLFYRLILNYFSYRGPQYAYEKPRDNKLVSYKYINILEKT